MKARCSLRSLLFAVTATAVFAAPVWASIVTNPGFEEVTDGGGAAGWSWSVHGARASMHTESTGGRAGSRCVVITNESGREPDVYARLQQSVAVLPGVEYELSVWVKGEDIASPQDFTDWWGYSLNTPTGTFDWQRISVRFRTKPDQTALNLGLNVVDRCGMLAVDDISLRAIGQPLKGGLTGQVVAPGRVVGDGVDVPISVEIDSARTDALTIELSILAGGSDTPVKLPIATIKPGDTSALVQWNTGSAPARHLKCSVRAMDGKKVLATGSTEIEKVSPITISEQLSLAEKRLPEFLELYRKCGAKGIPLDYPRVAKTTLDQFIPLTREDLERNELARAANEAEDLHRVLDESIRWMRFYLANPRIAPNAVRYRTGKVDIEGPSFIGDRIDSRGAKSRGPVFFVGYGHFGQVGIDMPRWPGYGINIIQVEIPASAVLVSETEVDMKPVRDLARLLDEAAKRNVMVNVLLGTHYFPAWALQKWPRIAKPVGGFFPYSIDMPEAKFVIAKFLKAVVPALKDKPALHSFCLSNEPLFGASANSDNSRQMYTDYLTRGYGDIASLNAAWSTSYPSFADVPLGQGYDWWVFSQERFAAWHSWVADRVHEIAPNVPTHAKITMEVGVLNPNAISSGLDPELFGSKLEINGNDCIIMPEKVGGWGIFWQIQNAAYDMQRSFNAKPIFNSENHITHDGSPEQFPPENFRMALWQGAIHGQGATTIWVWEHTFHDLHFEPSFYGNVMDHPASAHIVGLTCLDLNRFAAEVTAIQNLKSPVAILYSRASAMDRNYIGSVLEAYAALNFCGVRVDFISDRQMARGEGARYRMIVLPNTTAVPEDVFGALTRLPSGVKLVMVGNCLEKNPYGKPYAADAVAVLKSRSLIVPGQASGYSMWPALREELDKLGALPDVQVVDAKSGKPLWGVEWLPARVGNRIVANIINLREKPAEVKLISRGQDVPARDLLSLGGREQVRVLKPIVPVLGEVEPVGPTLLSDSHLREAQR